VIPAITLREAERLIDLLGQLQAASRPVPGRRLRLALLSLTGHRIHARPALVSTFVCPSLRPASTKIAPRFPASPLAPFCRAKVDYLW